MSGLLRSRVLSGTASHCCRAPHVLPVLINIRPRRYKSSGKKGNKKGMDRLRERQFEDEIEGPSVNEVESSFGTRIDRAKAQEGTITIITGERDVREGERFDLQTMLRNMDEVVNQLRAQLKPIMGQISAALDTSVVDTLMVDHHEMGRVPISSLAAVSKAQGGGLKVSVFEPRDMQDIESTLKQQSLQASRSGMDNNVFLVTPVRFDEQRRQQLLASAQKILRQADEKADRAREAANKDLSADSKNKIIDDREFRRQGRDMEAEARKRLKEIGSIRAEVKKLILDK